ncbi:hypothetical protein T09_8596 [Trichinella sp. T9]|nr:hypothetical protein T09_8596 [Trichinella sp. T9]
MFAHSKATAALLASSPVVLSDHHLSRKHELLRLKRDTVAYLDVVSSDNKQPDADDALEKQQQHDAMEEASSGGRVLKMNFSFCQFNVLLCSSRLIIRMHYPNGRGSAEKYIIRRLCVRQSPISFSLIMKNAK